MKIYSTKNGTAFRRSGKLRITVARADPAVNYFDSSFAFLDS
jgi:hypothetical protein